MKEKFFGLKKYIPLVLIFLLEIILFILNYKNGSFLVGWDNLFPELNFGENFKRSFFAIWQEYRGLGLLDGMAYAANLSHYLFIYLLSFVFPLNFLRYIFVFFVHFLGGAGIYLLSEKLIKNKTASFFAGIFYLFNLATVQAFYVPFELFLVHFAFLPILIYSGLRFLESGSKKDLIGFSLLSILSWPQAHVPTIFIVYFGALITFVLFSFSNGLKRKIIILFMTLAVNAPWALPYVYSAINSAQTISNSKINIASSDDIYLKNKAFGNFSDTVLLKGFELGTVEVQPNRSSGYMMPDWKSNSENIFFKVIGFSFFGIAILGFVRSLIKKQKKLIPVSILFIISLVMLGQDIPILNLIPQFLNNHIPMFKQVFRFTYTKFSLLFAFSFSILLGNGLKWFFEKKAKLIKAILCVTLFCGIIFYSLPAWQGNFLYDNLRLKIPDEYFETINFFKNNNKNTRVATFPQPNFWGWTYTDWGLRGSGFQWFGIPQPTLDGAFLPWSRENENYYWEISYALYSKNLLLFEKVLEKYQINWLLVDGNVINPGSSKALFLDELEAMIGVQSNRFELVNTFGKIKIYKVNLQTPVKDFVFLENNLPAINSYDWGNEDIAYADNGNYVNAVDKELYYPFRSLFTGRVVLNSVNEGITIEDKGDHYIFKKKLPEDVQNYDLIEPEYSSRELGYLSSTDSAKINYFIPRTEVVNGNIEVNVPKISNLTTVINPFYVPSILIAENCNMFSKGTVSSKSKSESKSVVLEATDATNCSAAFYLPELLHKYGYLISVESKNVSGKSLLFWIDNLTNHKADLELYLDQKSNNSTPYNLTPNTYIIQPPMAEDGLGYTLHFDNVSIGREKTVNELGKITLNPIPYEYLMGIKLVNREGANVSNLEGVLASHLEVKHPNPAFYEVKLSPDISISSYPDILILSQAYHEGWLGYETNSKFKVQSSKLWRIFPFFYGEQLEHVKVNNWENGWKISNPYPLTPKTYILVFWPQYLEYFGFVILVGALGGLVLYNYHK